jgi:hypothetical protein
VHLHLERVRGRRRRRLAPERVGEPIAGDDLPGREEQGGQEPCLPSGPDREHAVVVDDLQRPENEELHQSALHARSGIPAGGS